MVVYKKPDDTIPIIIRDLSDDQMREMMIRENAEEFGCVPAAIDDAVQAARDYLEGHKEKVREALTSNRLDVKRVRLGATAIAEYTGYSKIAVELSLQRLAAIASGEVDKEALYKMPHQQAALRFARAVLESRTKPTEEDQRKVAEHLIKEDKFGEASINFAFKDFLPAMKKNDPRHPDCHNRQLHKAVKQIADLIRTLQNIERNNHFRKDAPTMEDVSQLTMHSYNQSVYRLAEKIMDMAGLVEEGLPWIVDDGPPAEREPDQADILRLEMFLLQFFNREMSKEYEFTCWWDIKKRWPVVTSKKRPWTEAEKEGEAKRLEAMKAEMKRLAMEREKITATVRERIEKTMARVQESAQENQTDKETG